MLGRASLRRAGEPQQQTRPTHARRGRRFSSKKISATVANITARKITIGIVIDRPWKIVAARGRISCSTTTQVHSRDLVGPLLLAQVGVEHFASHAQRALIAARGEVGIADEVDQWQKVAALAHDHRRGDDLPADRAVAPHQLADGIARCELSVENGEAVEPVRVGDRDTEPLCLLPAVGSVVGSVAGRRPRGTRSA